MIMTEANKRAVKKYQTKCDAIMLRPSKEDGQLVRSAAKSAGKSVQKFIMDIVLEHINDNKNPLDPENW